MPGGVDEIEVVDLAVARPVVQADRLGLDGDATLLFQIHGIEHLCRHLPIRQPATDLDEAICQRRLAMVDMRDDREVADVSLLHGIVDVGGRACEPLRACQQSTNTRCRFTGLAPERGDLNPLL